MEGAIQFLMWFAVAVLVIRLIAVLAESLTLRLLCSLVLTLTYFFATILAFVVFVDLSWLVGVLALMCFIIYALYTWSDLEEYVKKS